MHHTSSDLVLSDFRESTTPRSVPYRVLHALKLRYARHPSTSLLLPDSKITFRPSGLTAFQTRAPPGAQPRHVCASQELFRLVVFESKPQNLLDESPSVVDTLYPSTSGLCRHFLSRRTAKEKEPCIIALSVPASFPRARRVSPLIGTPRGIKDQFGNDTPYSTKFGVVK